MGTPHIKHHRPYAWLWWVFFFVLAAGGGAIFYLQDQPQSLQVRQLTSLVILITAIGGGLSLICATANFWLKR